MSFTAIVLVFIGGVIFGWGSLIAFACVATHERKSTHD